LNTPLFFKGVTIGTLIEDAPVVSATYTGRDIKPWSVAGVDAQFSGLDIIVNWARRTRGPLAGEWLDGTGVVPLGETIEQYEITLTDGTSSVTKTVNDVATVTFLEADFSGFLSPLSVTVQQVSGISSTIKSPAILTPVGDTGLGPPPSILGFETTVSLTGASVVVTKPTGTAEGDLMVAFMGVDEDEVTPPAGWTEIWSDLGTRARGYAWYKVAGASEPSNYTFTIDTSQGHVASIITVQGQGDVPIEASGSTLVDANGVNHIAPTITTLTNKSLLLGNAVGGWGGFTYTAPGDMTELFDIDTGGAGEGQIMTVAHREFGTAGATGTRTFVCTGSIHSVAGLIAIPPALQQ
jgi:hypothetical protein